MAELVAHGAEMQRQTGANEEKAVLSNMRKEGNAGSYGRSGKGVGIRSRAHGRDKVSLNHVRADSARSDRFLDDDVGFGISKIVVQDNIFTKEPGRFWRLLEGQAVHKDFDPGLGPGDARSFYLFIHVDCCRGLRALDRVAGAVAARIGKRLGSFASVMDAVAIRVLEVESVIARTDIGSDKNAVVVISVILEGLSKYVNLDVQ